MAQSANSLPTGESRQDGDLPADEATDSELKKRLSEGGNNSDGNRKTDVTSKADNSQSVPKEGMAEEVNNAGDGRHCRVSPSDDVVGKGVDGRRKRKRRLLKFNVGGTIFVTGESTVFNTQTDGVKLANRDFVNSLYDPDLGEYFLDRDPEVFRSILNFLRSGKLHIPTTLCGPQVKEELDYWGVSPIHIQPCCWSAYSSGNSTMESLEQLERDSKLAVLNRRDEEPDMVRWRVWRTLTDPSESLAAKVYGWVALLFVMVAIFSFVVSTHPAFRVPISPANRHPPPKNNVLPNRSSTTMSPLLDNINTTAAFAKKLAKADTSTRGVDDLLKETKVHVALWSIDIVCLIFFSLEYVLKVACAPKRCKFIVSFNGAIDVLAMSPDYVEFLVVALDPEQIQSGQFMLFMPFLRLMRAFRIFRLIRHVPGLWIMLYTLKASYKDLSLMLIFLLVGTLLFASVIFFVDDKETFKSIPHSFWWAIVTMTTVGYGDMYPVTWPGYLIGSITAVCGVLIIGFTIPALVNNFILYYQHVEYAVQKEKLRKMEAKDDKTDNKKSCGGSERKRADKEAQDNGVESVPLVKMK